MALESGTYIKDLVSTNPPGTDAISQGDDHLRLIKSTIQASFPSNTNAPTVPNITGNGLKYLQVNSGATATQWSSFQQKGYINRATFAYSSATQILIGSGEYELDDGSTPVNYSWDSQLTFVIGSGGSNAASSAAGTSQWQYLYMDDSNISASPLVAGSFLNSTTAPTYNQSKHGWYNGSDRCIFGFYINSSGNIDKFYHDGADHVMYADDFDTGSNVGGNQGWVDVTVQGPAFADSMELTFKLSQDGDFDLSTTFYARVDGDSGTGHLLGSVEGGGDPTEDEHVSSSKRFFVNPSNRMIEINGISNATADGGCITYINGYFFPGGM
jgi:hypothetical protein